MSIAFNIYARILFLLIVNILTNISKTLASSFHSITHEEINKTASQIPFTKMDRCGHFDVSRLYSCYHSPWKTGQEEILIFLCP